MNINDLEQLVVNALEDIKAKKIEIINTSKLTAFFDRIVVASADSNRQTRALAYHVQAQAKQAGVEVVGFEGEQNAEWILVDLGDIVVHIMQQAVRDYYRLEDLWEIRQSA